MPDSVHVNMINQYRFVQLFAPTVTSQLLRLLPLWAFSLCVHAAPTPSAIATVPTESADMAAPVWLLACTLGPIAVAGTVYAVRKLREYQWGWVRDRYSLEGRVYVVTGANTGLGFEATKALAARHATVIMACRSAERANEAITRIRQTTANGNLVTIRIRIYRGVSIRSNMCCICVCNDLTS